MAAPASLEAQKRAAALAAVDEIVPGMLIGLGTGTTAAYAIAEIGRRVAGGLAISAAATSDASARAARALGIPLIDFAAVGRVDLCIDGVDEIDPAFRAIKGGGGAMLREKVVAASARRNIAIADGSKRVAALGARPVPLEVLPLARAFVARAAGALGGRPALRPGPGGEPYRTDQDNLILDCAFDRIADPVSLAAALAAIPGVLGHGLFADEIDALYVACDTGLLFLERSGAVAG